MATNKNAKVSGIVYKQGDLRINGTPLNQEDAVNKKYVDDAIAGASVTYISQDGIYDNAGTPATDLSKTFVIGDVIECLQTSGTFIAGKLYKCSIAGDISTGAFIEITNRQDGTIIQIADSYQNPNNTNVQRPAGSRWAYDVETDSYLASPIDLSSGASFVLRATVNYTDTSVSFNYLPANSAILSFDATFETQFSTGGTPLLKIGTITQDDLVINSAVDFSLPLSNYISGNQENGDIITTLNAPMIFANRTEIFAKLSGLVGATAGKINIVLYCVKL